MYFNLMSMCALRIYVISNACCLDLISSGVTIRFMSCPLIVMFLYMQEHYKDLKGRPFYPKLIDYITSGPVVAMVRIPFFHH